MTVHPLWRPFELPSDEEVAAVRVGRVPAGAIEVVAPDPRWAREFEVVRDRIRAALGAVALSVEHVGSTSVPDLWAKPYIDVDLLVRDPADEDSYVPALESQGFRLVVREPEWEERRVLKLLEPNTNLHVFPPDAQEPQRHRLFRDWLRTHPEDRDAYGAHKREVAARGFTDSMHYNNAKAAFVYDLYERILLADPTHEHTPQPRPDPA